MSELARRADILIPTTTFAEMDGTFTNFEGRVQRFSQSLRPPGMARPLWLTGSAALARLEIAPPFRTAGAAFAAAADEIDAFSGLSYEKIGLFGATVEGAASGAAAPSS